MALNPLVSSYDPKKVILTFGGAPISGYADGTMIEVVPTMADGFTKQVGADGEVARAQSADNTHEVTITLMQTSLSNQVLKRMRNVDKLSGAAMLPLSIIDPQMGCVALWPQAWIKGDPTWTRGKDLAERQWVISTGQIAEDNLA